MLSVLILFLSCLSNEVPTVRVPAADAAGTVLSVTTTLCTLSNQAWTAEVVGPNETAAEVERASREACYP